MKHFTLACSIFLSSILYAQVNTKASTVRGYNKKNGTHTFSYHRTPANKSKLDNYSHKGNINPYTSKKGYKD